MIRVALISRAEFRHIYGMGLREEWKHWIAAERARQNENLAVIRKNPSHPDRSRFRPKLLGSVSRPYLDPKTGLIYAAVRHTGRMAYLAAIDPATGHVEHLTDVHGGALYYVTSLAFDPDGRRLFFTTNNNGLRTLNVFDLSTRKTRCSPGICAPAIWSSIAKTGRYGE